MHLRVILLVTVLSLPLAHASPYWSAWDGTELPEIQGPWLRALGYGGATRTLADGIMTYDSLRDINIWDYSYYDRQQKIDPEPGEIFVMEWRLNVRKVIGSADPGVGLFSDESWAVGLTYTEDAVLFNFEGFATIPIAPHMFHEYRLTSTDMRTYALYIDGALARQGAFSQRISKSLVDWGDFVQGASSLHDWDYFRFGVMPVPEPGSFLAALCVLSVVACQRGTLFR